MKLLKKLAFYIVSYTIHFILFATISTSVTVAIIGSSQDVKDVLSNTKSYERFVPAVIDANKKLPQSSSSLNYDDPKIVQIITESFSADSLKHTTEGVIDSLYAWLNGRTDTLQFTADFSKNKEVLADKLSTYAFTRLASLPKCTSLPETVNPLLIDCRPTGINLEEVQASYRQQLLQSDSFLSKTTLTEHDLPKNTKGKTLPEQYAFAPRAFQWLLKAPYILGGLTLLLAGLYIWFSPKIRKGVSGLGTVLLSSGASLAAFPILFNVVLPKFTTSFEVQNGTQGPQAIYSDIFDQISSHFYTLFITIGIQLFIAGLSIYLLERATRTEGARYKNLEKKAGVLSSNQKAPVSPKSLRGKLSVETIPVQSSDLPARMQPKRVDENKKYAKLYKKKPM